MDKLKLFVLGQTSSDPEKWNRYQGWSLVLARDAQEALSMDDAHSIATEVVADEPIVLCYLSPGGDV
jgi:hypothetical protein